MCTATWIRARGGYEVFFNRDELATRKPALPPTLREREGVRFLAPVDGDAGGTWIGVNERGIAVGLANGPSDARSESTVPEQILNDLDAGPSPGIQIVENLLRHRTFRSRGLLVLDLLASASLGDLERRISAVDPSAHRSFALFAIDPRGERGGEAAIWSSDRERISRLPGCHKGALLFSSSRDAERARSERQALLERMTRAHGGLDAELLAAFHARHEPERGAYSPCMHREDASTVSFTRIRVDDREVEVQYRAGSPCEAGPIVTEHLLRRES